MTQKTIDCVVMFADVAGSTAMYENMGDNLARERISGALNTLISISQQHAGQLVKTIGDEILVYFTDVDMAIHAALQIQQTMENDQIVENIGVAIRIGMQFGSTLLEDSDIYGDTVNVAARIADMAAARQVLCAEEVVSRVDSVGLKNKMRPLDRLRVKGRKEPLNIYLLAWEDDVDATTIATTNSFMQSIKKVPSLKLRYNEQQYDVPQEGTYFFIGRDKECELTVAGYLISRYHTKIENRRGKFIITDQSTNGTFIKTQEGQEIFLRREEHTLIGSGYIGLGKKVDLDDQNLIQYYIE